MKTKIVWKHLVLGVRGDNFDVVSKYILNIHVYSKMYSIYDNWCKKQDNNLMFVPGREILACKMIISS